MKRKLGLLALAVFFILTSAITGTLANVVEATEIDAQTICDGKTLISQGIAGTASSFQSFSSLSSAQGSNGCTYNSGSLHVAVYDDNFSWKESKKDFNWESDKTVSLWSGISNVQDKFICVKNIGSTSAYVRTVFAFEADTTGFSGDLIHKNWNCGSGWSVQKIDETVTITTETGPKQFELYVATYDSPLAQNVVTPPSLLQIAMDKTAGNKEVTQFGDSYEILIYSMAVTTDISTGENSGEEAVVALNTAFGAISTDNHPWNGIFAAKDGQTT